MLFVVVNARDGTLPFAWLIPSEEFLNQFGKPNGQGRYAFAASTKESSRDRWSKYRCEQAELPALILATLDALARKGAS